MEEWITVKQAAKIRKCTERNIIELIQKKELEAKKDGRKWLIFMEASETVSETSPQFSEIISVLKAQLQEKDKQIALLQEQAGQLNQLLAMEKQEKLQLIEAKKPWHQRWFNKSKKG